MGFFNRSFDDLGKGLLITRSLWYMSNNVSPGHDYESYMPKQSRFDYKNKLH